MIINPGHTVVIMIKPWPHWCYINAREVAGADPGYVKRGGRDPKGGGPGG